MVNPNGGGGGHFTPPQQFFACPAKKIIDNVAIFVLTFSFGQYARVWAKIFLKKSIHGRLRGNFLSALGRFSVYQKSLFELWSPNSSRYKIFQKTKNVPLDEIYHFQFGLQRQKTDFWLDLLFESVGDEQDYFLRLQVSLWDPKTSDIY